jgi:hypothetical protein
VGGPQRRLIRDPDCEKEPRGHGDDGSPVRIGHDAERERRKHRAARQELPGIRPAAFHAAARRHQCAGGIADAGPGLASPELARTVEALEIATERGLPLYAAMREHRTFSTGVHRDRGRRERAGTLSRMLVPPADGLADAPGSATSARSARRP